jgi:hypothetical protein
MRTMSSKQWHGGKGDTPRVGNDEAYRSNWDRIFGGIDYKDEDLLEGLYHSEKMKGRLTASIITALPKNIV